MIDPGSYLGIVEDKLKFSLTTVYAIFYVVLLIFVAIDLTNTLHLFRSIYDELNHLPVHVIGIISLLASFKNKIARRLAWHKIKLLFSKQNSETILESNNFAQALTEKDIQSQLLEFSKDATAIKIFAGDMTFLINSDKTPSAQFQEIKKFGNQCQLLFSEVINVDVDLLKELSDNRVQLRLYPKSKPNFALRGRIKTTAGVQHAMLFDKEKDLYISQKIKNKYIVDMLIDEYEDVFHLGRNALIKYVLFDLAGVYCEGDFATFLNAVEDICGHRIPNRSSNYLLVDDRLNLGTDGFTIIDYVEEKCSITLTNDQKIKIRQVWNKTWILNSQMKELALDLKENGYIVAICSNCDEDNGEMYGVNNYFDGLDKFFSYEMKLLKPGEEYFQYILDKYNCKPFECLFIDDHERNIETAKNIGFSTIKVARDHSESEKVIKLKKEFDSLSIQYNTNAS